MYKMICVGLGFESYSKVVDDEAEHDVSGAAVSKKARSIGVLGNGVPQ
jgi:hypothetical protein